MSREVEGGGCNTCRKAGRNSIHDSPEPQQPKHTRCWPRGNKRKEKSFNLCLCVDVYRSTYACFSFPVVNVATTGKPLFFTLKPEETANLRQLSFTESAWLQEKCLLVNSYWIRIFRKLWNFLRIREVRGTDLGWETTHPNWSIRYFPRSLEVDHRIAYYATFLIKVHHYLIIVPFTLCNPKFTK